MSWNSFVNAMNDLGKAHDQGVQMNTNAATMNLQNVMTGKAPEQVADVISTIGEQIENSTKQENISANMGDTANNENIFGWNEGEMWKNMTNAERVQWSAMQEEMKYNSNEARKNREWQENMFKNQWKWTVDGLKEAGLNPTLLFGNGMTGQAFSGGTAHSGASNFVTQNRTETQEKGEVLELFKIITNAALAIGLGKGMKK